MNSAITFFSINYLFFRVSSSSPLCLFNIRLMRIGQSYREVFKLSNEILIKLYSNFRIKSIFLSENIKKVCQKQRILCHFNECFFRKSHITLFASISFDVFPIAVSGEYWKPPGHVCPPFAIVYKTTSDPSFPLP